MFEIKPVLTKQAGLNNPVDCQCSFCSKGTEEVVKLVHGPSVYICNECVRLAARLCGYTITESA